MKQYTALASTDTNVSAFLSMIRKCEGTAGANGYRTLFGGGLFDDYSAHPNRRIPFRNTFSTAAGAYQILYRTWNECRAALALPDFSPASQDAAAVYLIQRRRALDDVKAGRFTDALSKCRKEWASLPGAGYNQPEKTLAAARAYYTAAGGTITA